MIIFPAIDLCEGQAVRLYKGDFEKKTVYSNDPLSVANDFVSKGATHVHIVDLDGARTGTPGHFELIKRIKDETGLFTQTGGGIRKLSDIESYVSAGIDRVVLGTKAAEDPAFLGSIPNSLREKVAVGVDIKDGYAAVKGWTEKSGTDVFTFCGRLVREGIRTIVCTDINRDGTMQGANGGLYKEISEKFDLDIIASGGVSSPEDVKRLRDAGLYGAIIGKAYYIGAVDLRQAIEVGG